MCRTNGWRTRPSPPPSPHTHKKTLRGKELKTITRIERIEPTRQTDQKENTHTHTDKYTKEVDRYLTFLHFS